ncbi:hypothetical protein C7C46_18545 [Streptomyces tateyamensis]|uniref:UPF0434 protein C7C46_18545 n=1 Tax=Streptomyces tateyamensis TaxID=565073 RepID=A0A2V4N493_9ACTN|nr:Trm112 family protein [Streptomyces tateyamensis]PYC77647.1 hypothetical protein C7C46_18545 [Streptomyces tateyamensis]
MTLEPFLLEILVCPRCHAKLSERSEDGNAELVCTGADCGLIYEIRDGIPLLLVDEARHPA